VKLIELKGPLNSTVPLPSEPQTEFVRQVVNERPPIQSMVVPTIGLIWLVAGGLMYTVGVVFYACKKIPYNHVIWHVFVMAGSTCHYFAVVYSVIPQART
jgi:predicted membrane channel-forming protein YqfA (hemolysin III family)